MLGWAILLIIVAIFFFASIELKFENQYNSRTTTIYKPSNTFFMKIVKQ